MSFDPKNCKNSIVFLHDAVPRECIPFWIELIATKLLTTKLWILHDEFCFMAPPKYIHPNPSKLPLLLESLQCTQFYNNIWHLAPFFIWVSFCSLSWFFGCLGLEPESSDILLLEHDINPIHDLNEILTAASWCYLLVNHAFAWASFPFYGKKGVI